MSRPLAPEPALGRGQLPGAHHVACRPAAVGTPPRVLQREPWGPRNTWPPAGPPAGTWGHRAGPVRSLGRTAGRRSFCQGSGRVPAALGPTGPSAHHHQVAGGGCGRLPFADGGQVAPRPVPQGWPGRSGSRRMRPPPFVLLSLLLQNPAHNLVPSELLLLLEGAAGRCRGLGAPPSPGSRVDAWRPGGCQARPQDANPGPRPVPWGVAPAPSFQAGSQGAPTEAHAKAA